MKRCVRSGFVLLFGFALAASLAGSADKGPQTVVDKAVEAAGGRDKLLALFRIKEKLVLGADPKGKPMNRTSILEPPKYWWVGKTERVKAEKEPAVFLVWAWTLGALIDPKSKLEVLPKAKLDDKPVVGVRITETIEPPLDVFFDPQTHRLVGIEWRGDRHLFGEWKKADGVWYAAKCSGYKKSTGKAWYHTEIVELERLKELPKGLSRE